MLAGSIVIFVLYTFFRIYSSPEALGKAKSFVTDPKWLTMLLGTIVVVIIIKTTRLKNIGTWNKGCNAGMNGIIIALFASIDFTLAPFWFILTLTALDEDA